MSDKPISYQCAWDIVGNEIMCLKCGYVLPKSKQIAFHKHSCLKIATVTYAFLKEFTPEKEIAENWKLCFKTARKNAKTVWQQSICDSSVLICPDCPFKNNCVICIEENFTDQKPIDETLTCIHCKETTNTCSEHAKSYFENTYQYCPSCHAEIFYSEPPNMT